MADAIWNIKGTSVKVKGATHDNKGSAQHNHQQTKVTTCPQCKAEWEYNENEDGFIECTSCGQWINPGKQ